MRRADRRLPRGRSPPAATCWIFLLGILLSGIVLQRRPTASGPPSTARCSPPGSGSPGTAIGTQIGFAHRRLRARRSPPPSRGTTAAAGSRSRSSSRWSACSTSSPWRPAATTTAPRPRTWACRPGAAVRDRRGEPDVLVSGAPPFRGARRPLREPARRRGQHFLGYDDRAGEPHPTAYYVWLATNADHVVLVDAGIDPARPRAIDGTHVPRARPSRRSPSWASRPEQVDHVVLSHLHYDHTGTAAAFPAARYVRAAAGARLLDRPGGRPHPPRALAGQRRGPRPPPGAARRPARPRRRLAEVVPGLEVHHVGGHTAGMQVVRVRTAAGPVVLASDARPLPREPHRRPPAADPALRARRARRLRPARRARRGRRPRRPRSRPPCHRGRWGQPGVEGAGFRRRPPGLTGAGIRARDAGFWSS